MSRFRKLSQTIWHCQYHIIWVPKYRYRILNGQIGREVENCVRKDLENRAIGVNTVCSKGAVNRPISLLTSPFAGFRHQIGLEVLRWLPLPLSDHPSI